MTFSSQAWERNKALYETIRTMPFNWELGTGELAQSAFKHYMIQDAHYLVAFGRALAVAGAKADTPEQVMQMTEFAKVAIIVERDLHDSFLKKFGVSSVEFEQTPLTQACDHYTSYLLATAWSAPYPVVLAALLPCFWIYAEIGKDIYKNSVSPNPYQAWIDTYAGEEFHSAVRAMILTVDEVAKQASPKVLEQMHQAFTHATKLEWMFWDSAYREATWPV